ncbi:MAG: hypothetical protein H6563_12935 [Lewinellaceae bacterium]|nr:hypothetical protein [Lewinellaceae bacterium]
MDENGTGREKAWVKYLILLLHLGVLLAYHQSGYLGHYGFDDLHYAQLAHDLNHGIVDFNNHYSYRISIIGLTALSYKLFGVSDFASALPPLLLSAGILSLVFALLRNKPWTTLFAGLSLTTFSNWYLFYSDKLMPDIYVAFSVMAALFILHKYKYGSPKNRPAGYALLFALALLFGFISKGTILLVAPLLLYLAAIDLIYKRDLRFWAYSAVFGVTLLAVYFAGIWFLTGDFAKRFEAIVNNSYLNLCSYDQQPWKYLLGRISYQFFNLTVYDGLFTGYVFVLVYVLRRRVRDYFRFETPFSFFLVSSVILFLSANFMSTSFSAYTPMCLDPRHYLFLVPVVSIPAASILTAFLEKKKGGYLLLLLLGLLSALSFFLPGNAFWELFLPLTALILLYFLFGKSAGARVIFMLLLALVLAIKPFHSLKYARKVRYRAQKEVVFDQILNRKEDCYVITNEVQKRLGDYYSGFEKNGKTFLSYGKFDPDTLHDRKILLLTNGYTRYLSNTSRQDLPLYARQIDPANPRIYEDSSLGMSIYEMNKLVIPERAGRELLHSSNGFERAVEYWVQDDDLLTSEPRREGDRSIRVEEFSATFAYPLDSLRLTSRKGFVISGRVFCFFPDRPHATVVVSVEKNGEAYIWKGFPIDKYIKAYSNWWPVPFSTDVIRGEEFKEGSTLKVYLWNPERKTACIDDFEVSIFELE